MFKDEVVLSDIMVPGYSVGKELVIAASFIDVRLLYSEINRFKI